MKNKATGNRQQVTAKCRHRIFLVPRNWCLMLNSRGFTLIEIILYVAVAGAVLYVASLLYVAILDNDARNNTHASVDESSAHALQIIIDAIRHAENVEEPAHQSMGGDLSLRMADPDRDPTNFSLVTGAVLMQEGNHDPITITSLNTVVDGLSFENLSANDKTDSVRVQLDASYRDSTRPETTYAHTYYATATTR
jgi:Tfp pilus assembly protein PilW